METQEQCIKDKGDNMQKLLDKIDEQIFEAQEELSKIADELTKTKWPTSSSQNPQKLHELGSNLQFWNGRLTGLRMMRYEVTSFKKRYNIISKGD